MNSSISYGKKVEDPPEREVLNLANHVSDSVVDPHVRREEQCDALCGRSTTDANIS